MHALSLLMLSDLKTYVKDGGCDTISSPIVKSFNLIGLQEKSKECKHVAYNKQKTHAWTCLHLVLGGWQQGLDGLTAQPKQV